MVAKQQGPDPADKNGERGIVFIPGGKKYKGQWVDNKITGEHPPILAAPPRPDFRVTARPRSDPSRPKSPGRGFHVGPTATGTTASGSRASTASAPWRQEHGKHRVEYNGTWVRNRQAALQVICTTTRARRPYEGAEWARRQEARAR